MKECKEVLSGPLANMFDKSVNINSFPSLWNAADVTLIFKMKNRSSIFNVCSINLTSVIGKLESVITLSFQYNPKEHGSIKDSQHGFPEVK